MRFEKAIRSDHKLVPRLLCFSLGDKQERTPTWYGMFLDSGEETAAVDMMQYLWNGVWPANRSPESKGAWLDGKTASQNVRLNPAELMLPKCRPATLIRTRSLTWEVMEESTDLKTGGDFEMKPERLPGLIRKAEAAKSF